MQGKISSSFTEKKKKKKNDRQSAKHHWKCELATLLRDFTKCLFLLTSLLNFENIKLFV